MAAPMVSRLKPDSSLAQNVDSVAKNRTFKRMLLFSLRALKDQLIDTYAKHTDNGYEAVKLGLTEMLNECINSFKSDPEFAELAVYIIQGMMNGLIYAEDPEMVKKFMAGGSRNCISSLLDNKYPSSVMHVLLGDAAIYLSLDPNAGPDIFGKLLNIFDDKLTAADAAVVGNCIAACGKCDLPKESLKSVGTILKWPLQHSNLTDAESVTATQKLLRGLGLVLAKQIPSDKTKLLSDVVDIMEKTTDEVILRHGSVILEMLITSADLDRALKGLKSTDEKTRSESLITLASVSLIPQYGDAVAKSDSIPILVECIRASVEAPESLDLQSLKGLAGACKMIGTVATKKENRKKCKDAGAVDVLMKAYQTVEQDPRCSAAILHALTKFAVDSKTRQKIADEISDSLIQYTSEYANHVGHSFQVTALLEKLILEEPNGERLVEDGLIDCVLDVLDITHDPDVLVCALKILTKATSMIDDISAVEFISEALPKVLATNSEPQLIQHACIFILQASKLEGGVEIWQGKYIVKEISAPLLNHTMGSSQTKLVLQVIDLLVTERDLSDLLETLKRTLDAAHNDPDSAVSAIANLNAFAQRPKCASILIKDGAHLQLMEAVERWMKRTPFASQKLLIYTALQAVIPLARHSEEIENIVIDKIVDMLKSNQLQSLLQKQDFTDNSGLDMIGSLLSIINSPRDPVKLTESILEIRVAHQMSKQMVITATKILLLLSKGDESVCAVIHEKGLVTIMQNMRKAIWKEEEQIWCLRLIHQLLQTNPSYAETMKRNNALNLLNSINRAHKSTAIKVELLNVGRYLFDDEEIFVKVKELADQVDTIPEDVFYVKNLEEPLQELAFLTNMTAGKHAAVSVGIGQMIGDTIMKLGKAADTPALGDTLNMLADIVDNVAGTARGLGHIGKRPGLQDLIKLFDMQSKCAGSSPEALASTAKVISKLLNPNNIGMAKEQGLFDICESLQKRFKNHVELNRMIGDIMAKCPQEMTSDKTYNNIIKAFVEGMQDNDIDNSAASLHGLNRTCFGNKTNAKVAYADGGVMAVNAFLLAAGEAASQHSGAAAELLTAMLGSKSEQKWDIKELPLTDFLANCRRQCEMAPTAVEAAQWIQVIRICASSSQLSEVADISSLQDLVESLMLKFSNDPALLAEASKLLTVLGDTLQFDLIRNITKTLNAREPAWENTTANLCRRLHLMSCPTDDVHDPRFKDVADMHKAMKEALKDSCKLGDRLDPDLIAAIAMSQRTMASNAPVRAKFGMVGAADMLVPSIGALLNIESSKLRDHAAGTAESFLLSATVVQNAMKIERVDEIMKVVKSENLVKRAQATLENHSTDAYVCMAALAFLRAVGAVDRSVVEDQYKVHKNARNVSDQLYADVTQTLKRHHDVGPVVIEGLGLLEHWGKQMNLDEAPAMVTDDKWRNELETIALESGPMAIAKYMAVINAHAHILSKGQYVGTIDNLIPTLDMIIKDTSKPKDARDAAAAAVAGAMVELHKLYGDEGIEIIKKHRMHEIIGFHLAVADVDGADNVGLHLALSRALSPCAADEELSAYAARNMVPYLAMELDWIKDLTGPDISTLLSGLQGIASYEGCGAAMLGDDPDRFARFMESLGMQIDDLQLTAEDMNDISPEKILQAVKDDKPEVDNLEKLYNKWSAQISQGKPPYIGGGGTIMAQLIFLMDYLDEYAGNKSAKISNEIGKELVYGLRCVALLLQDPTIAVSNVIELIERDVIGIYLKAVNSVSDPDVRQWIFKTFADATDIDDVASQLCRDDRVVEIGTKAVGDLKNITTSKKKPKELLRNPVAETITKQDGLLEEYLTERLRLIFNSAFSRKTYVGTNVMKGLSDVWGMYERDTGTSYVDHTNDAFSTNLMFWVVRALRKLLSESWAAEVIEFNILDRLLDIIRNEENDIKLLPDSLFAIGCLSNIKGLKDALSDADCVKLIHDCEMHKMTNAPTDSRPNGYDVEDQSKVMVNAQLSLANVCMVHYANTKRFVELKGVEANIQILNGGLNYDVRNAACVLMTNITFKRDDLKKMYGEAGACESVMENLNAYNGETDPDIVRCTTSMIKAIGNLTLYDKNVTRFIAADIATTFNRFLAMKNVPDQVIHAVLRTFSNMVMDLNDTIVEHFEICLDSLIKYLTRTLEVIMPEIHVMLLDCIGSLARNPKNAEKYMALGASKLIIKLMDLHINVKLHKECIHTLGILSNESHNIDIMIGDGVLEQFKKLLIECQSPEGDVSEIAVTLLRAIRRFIGYSKDAAQRFVDIGAVDEMTSMMAGLTHCKDAAMISLDGRRNMLALLNLFPPPSGKEMGSGWDLPVADEGLVDRVQVLDCGMRPRSYEQLKMSVQGVNSLIKSSLATMKGEAEGRHLRSLLASLGLIAYVASERIPGTVQEYYDGRFYECLTVIIENYSSELDVMRLILCLLGHLLYVSEADQYAMVMQSDLPPMLAEKLDSVPVKPSSLKKDLSVISQFLSDRPSEMKAENIMELLDTEKFSIIADQPFDFAWSRWNADRFPNGVQDLPLDLKVKIKEPQVMKAYINSTKQGLTTIRLKGSSDLILLQFGLGQEEGPMDNSLPMVNLGVISRIPFTSMAQQLLQNKLISDSTNIVNIGGGPTVDFPQGVDIVIMMSSKGTRDTFFNTLTDWREAATFGF